jgi:hypothetical protein
MYEYQGPILSTTDVSPYFTGLNNPVSKILRFTGKFLDIYIPYAMKLCPWILITLAPDIQKLKRLKKTDKNSPDFKCLTFQPK